ncbi:MAG: folate-binding protein [Gammaproteobacteria bacterium]|nr:MAG: folate-binding protein [Gammaproteobacteria bacterium]
MKHEWKRFLIDNGAEYDAEDRLVTFGNPEIESRAALSGKVFADLSHVRVIAVHGEDAREFLQNQFTLDVREVDARHARLGGYCTPKGRLLALFRIFHRDDTFYLSMPGDIADAFVQRLRLFVLRSRVTIEDVSETFVHLGAAGPDIETEFAPLFDAVPAAVDEVTRSGDCLLIRVPDTVSGHRFELYGPPEWGRRLWDVLNVRCAPVGEPVWRLLRILAGVPVVRRETLEAFVPQMVNLHLLGGVSFQKGCYPGQEVVARMQYLGKLKRRMYLLSIPEGREPAPGDSLYSPDDPDQAAGTVVDAAPHPDGGYRALAVLRIEAAEKGDLRFGTADGPEARILPLPYSWDTEG